MRIEARDLARCFGRNLVTCRDRADLSQEQLSFLASLHRTEIGMIERGIRLPRIDTQVKLAGSLEVSPGELLEGMIWTPSDRPVPRQRGRAAMNPRPSRQSYLYELAARQPAWIRAK